MAKQNYSAWNVKISDYSDQQTLTDKVRFLLQFAVLAPSGHNSQPWRFHVAENIIDVRMEMSRSLPASDANERQLLISIGCAIENILVAADYFGFFNTITYFPNAVDTSLAARIVLQPVPQNIRQENHLVHSIARRSTNRNSYTDKVPPASFLQKIKQLETSDIQLYFVTDQVKKEKISDIVSEALVVTMDDKNFRQELSHYLKSNLTRSSIGMIGAGFGIPTPVSFVAPWLIKFVNVNKLSKEKDEALLKHHTPVFGIIATKDDVAESWIKAGSLYERIALEATKENIKIHNLAAAIQADDYNKKLQDNLGITFHPQVFFRMGYTDTPAVRTPRLTANNVV